MVSDVAVKSAGLSPADAVAIVTVHDCSRVRQPGLAGFAQRSTTSEPELARGLGH